MRMPEDGGQRTIAFCLAAHNLLPPMAVETQLAALSLNEAMVHLHGVCHVRYTRESVG